VNGRAQHHEEPCGSAQQELSGVFTITMLPASQGDCLWVEYGSQERPHRILIDCGTSPTYQRHLKRRLAELRPHPYVDLLIVTHIDTDHIGGVLKLLDAPPQGLQVGQVWFNAWRHVAHDSLDIMGPVDGEILSCQLDKLQWNWNSSFRSKDRSARLPQLGRRLPSYQLPGGMKLTVVSPGIEQLRILRNTWQTVVEAGGLAPGIPSQTLVDKARQKGVRLDLLGGDRSVNGPTATQTTWMTPPRTAAPSRWSPSTRTTA
jgi:Metallo-beta-lactamase superfamily